MSHKVGKVIGRTVTVLLVLAVLAAAGVAYLHRGDISDYFAAQSFEAPAEIVAVADRLELTDTGHRVFFATHPTLDSSQRFNSQCAGVDHSEEGHVLGCYKRDSIHLFEVQDERLNGIVEVTAAHELLHAAWARMADLDRAELVDSLTELYDELAESDPELVDRMSVYGGLSSGAFANELHSVLGTEVRDLPEWLEQHYSRWFRERGTILDLFDAYHVIFVEIQASADELQAQLNTLRESVEERSSAYDAAVTQLNADVQDFNSRNEALEFSDDEARFWWERGQLEARSAELNAEFEAIQAEIAHYEQLRQELEELNAVNTELNQNLDSSLAPPAGV